MKKFIVVAILFLGCFYCLAEQEQDADIAETRDKSEYWDCFGLNFFPDVPSSAVFTNIYGVKIGAPISFGDGMVCGIETAAFACLTDEVAGIQACPLFCVSKKVYGLQTSIVNITDSIDGLQFGVVNIGSKSGFQLGIVNYMEDSWCPIMLVINFKF